MRAESEVGEQTLAYRLYSLEIQVYRVRLSGHYYLHELRDILGTIKPEKLVLVRTRHPSLVLNQANK